MLISYDADMTCEIVVETKRGNNVLEANMRVHNKQSAQDRVHNRVQAASCERRNCQWDQTGRYDALKAPVVAAVGRVGCGSRRGVIDTTPDDLGKRREDVSCSAGLEGRSRDRLENGLAPLDAESRHDGGSEGALYWRGECLAHEGGAERGGHFARMGVGVWGRMGEEGGESW